MKKKYLLIFSVLLIAFDACQDELNQVPISQASASNFYRNTSDFQAALSGVYNALGANPQTGNGYAVRRFDMSEVRSDNVYSPGTGVRDWNPINNFSKTLSTNPYMAEAWATNYIGISRANTLLDKLNETVVPDATTRSHIEGEAKFLRASFYFDLVRWFGKVPVINKVLTPTEVLNVTRSPVADVYTQIINDFNDAIAKLPDTYVTADKGRATSNAAKAMLGLVYLTRTGPTYGIEGPGMATTEYALAGALFDAVIASGKYSFVASYPSIFSYTNENNPDIVFDIQAINAGTSGDVGTGARFPSEMYDEAFGSKATTVCNPTCGTIGFAGGVPFDNSLSPKAPSKDFKNSLEVGDSRFTFSYLASYTNSSGQAISTGQFVKFVDATKKGVDRFNWPINYPVLRYTDVLLMKAECFLRGGVGSQAETNTFVNQVRARAGLGPLANVTLDQLLNERRHEFMAEGLRWHDLVRNGTVLTTMNAWKNSGVDDIGKTTIQTITSNDIIYPVPNTQIIISPGLYTQNPGY
jgi:starch-binding outer membrane protein, SusD/RagB family